MSIVLALMVGYTVFLVHFKPFYNKVHLRLAVFNQAAIMICLFLSFLIYAQLLTTLDDPADKVILYSMGFCGIALVFLSTFIVYPTAHVYLILKQNNICCSNKRKAKKVAIEQDQPKTSVNSVEMMEPNRKQPEFPKFKPTGKRFRVHSAFVKENSQDSIQNECNRLRQHNDLSHLDSLERMSASESMKEFSVDRMYSPEIANVN